LIKVSESAEPWYCSTGYLATDECALMLRSKLRLAAQNEAGNSIVSTVARHLDTVEASSSRTAHEYSNVIGSERPPLTPTGSVTCPNDRQRPRRREFASRGWYGYPHVSCRWLSCSAETTALLTPTRSIVYGPFPAGDLSRYVAGRKVQ